MLQRAQGLPGGTSQRSGCLYPNHPSAPWALAGRGRTSMAEHEASPSTRFSSVQFCGHRAGSLAESSRLPLSFKDPDPVTFEGPPCLPQAPGTFVPSPGLLQHPLLHWSSLAAGPAFVAIGVPAGNGGQALTRTTAGNTPRLFTKVCTGWRGTRRAVPQGWEQDTCHAPPWG